MYSCRVLADSANAQGNRLFTVEATYPRIVHSELMTHRQFSRNSASSRAIPVEKLVQRVLDDPFIPEKWPENQKGMQAAGYLIGKSEKWSEKEWLLARDNAIKSALTLMQYGVHKQVANRLIEPWMWITVIISATEWANFFKLRCHPEAQPEIQKIAYMIQADYQAHEPEFLQQDSWHLPLVGDNNIGGVGEKDLSIYDQIKISVGRCARVSYLTHDGVRDPAKDIELHNRLMNSGHWSPFEHVATPTHSLSSPLCGNFKGWKQYRKTFDEECA